MQLLGIFILYIYIREKLLIFIQLSVIGFYWKDIYEEGLKDGKIEGRLAGEQSIANRICKVETTNAVDFEKCVRCGLISDKSDCNDSPNCTFVVPFCSFF